MKGKVAIGNLPEIDLRIWSFNCHTPSSATMTRDEQRVAGRIEEIILSKLKTFPSEKTSVITGAGSERGIGRSVARRLAGLGVVGNYRSRNPGV